MSDYKVKNDEMSKIPPIWSWLFIIACAAIPIIAVGGAIPMAIGFGGIAGCYQAARDQSDSLMKRVLICVAITAIAWAIFGALIYFVATVI